MPHEPLIKSRLFPPALLALALLATSPASQAADASLGTQLCAVLTTVVPEVKMFDPMAARSHFVAAVSMKFRDDPVKMREVSAEIDRLTIASCRKERDGLLRITRMLSLSEAFDGGW